VQNFIKLSTAVHELSCKPNKGQENKKKTATILKTRLSSQLLTVMIIFMRLLCYIDDSRAASK